MEIKKMYINGEWVTGATGETTTVINPANGQEIASITKGGAEDVKIAAAAAKAAFDSGIWSGLTYGERGEFLNRIADLVEERIGIFAEVETLCQGMPLADSTDEMSNVVANFRYFASVAGTEIGSAFNGNQDVCTLTLREPIGVCGIIVPWNYPLEVASAHIPAALAAGNTVVFKPSSLTPLSALLLFEAMEEAGLPAGVVNLVLGDGGSVGAELSENEDIRKITFIGGTETGSAIMRGASKNIKNITLELGGKSALILFDDCDFEAAVDYAMMGIFVNAGQICVAGSRVLVQEGIYDKFVEEIARRAQNLKVGPGMDEDTQMGPMTSKQQMEQVLNCIEKGKNEGARLVCGGNRITEGVLQKGFFIQPTVFADVTNDMFIAQTEIFGPVLAIEKFSTEEEAIAIANDSRYGLAGGVFTNDGARGLRVAKGVQTGIMWVNCYYAGTSHCSGGGVKQSGIGIEGGLDGLREYTVQKQINISLNVEPLGFSQ